MVAPYVIFIELAFQLLRTSRLTYALAIFGVFNVLSTLYQAYHALGLTAYLVTFISYLPSLVSFVRMVARDTEASRLIFYRTIKKTWTFALMNDLFTLMFMLPAVNELCALIRDNESEEILLSTLIDSYD